MFNKKEFIEGVHYYLQNGMVIMTEEYHKQRGFCCGSGCKHCPYEPKHLKDNKKLDDNNKD
jgi:hypothetical protein